MTTRHAPGLWSLRGVLRLLAVVGIIGGLLMADGLVLKAEEHVVRPAPAVSDAPATRS